MMTLLGGIIAILVGFIFLGFWWEPFTILLQASIPVILILGGALSTYLGYEEWKDSQSAVQTGTTSYPNSEVERYKAEAEKYKAELEAMKAPGGEDKEPETSEEESA